MRYNNLLPFIFILSSTSAHAYWHAGDVEVETWGGHNMVYVDIPSPISPWSGVMSPCYQKTYCQVAVVIKNKYIGGYQSPWSPINGSIWECGPNGVRDLCSVRTVGEAERAILSSSYPPPKRVSWRYDVSGYTIESGQACLGYYVGTGGGLDGSYALWPGSSCSIVMPPDTTCELAPGVVMIDHGTLPVTEVVGHSASTNVVISCTRPTNLSIKSVNSGYINLGGGVGSVLSINGNIGSGNVVGTPAGTTVTVASKLQASGVISEGGFSGVDTLIMSSE